MKRIVTLTQTIPSNAHNAPCRLEVRIVRDTGGYRISAYAENEQLRTAWKPDKQSALRVALDLAYFYRDEHNQPAEVKDLALA